MATSQKHYKCYKCLIELISSYHGVVRKYFNYENLPSSFLTYFRENNESHSLHYVKSVRMKMDNFISSAQSVLGRWVSARHHSSPISFPKQFER